MKKSFSKLSRRNRQRKNRRLAHERLEDRRVLATVSLNTDTGAAGELRTELANAAPGETIDFNLPAGSETITLALGQLEIDKPVTIDGANSAGSGTSITINANNASRVINIDDGDPATQVQVGFSELTISGGNTTGPAPLNGAGIRNLESLSIRSSMISGNFSANNGGGIYSNGNLQLVSTSVNGNGAENRAGGIFGLGIISIAEDSIVSGNVIDTTTGDANGAGALFGAGSSTTIDSSTFSSNTGNTTYIDPVTMDEDNGRGGGIYVSGFADAIPTSITITNSTFDGNRTDGMAGAIQSGIAVTMVIENSTFSNNVAAGDAGAIGSSAFGNLAGASVTIRNSMITGNSAGDDGGGIEAAGGVTMTIEDSVIDGNDAYDRGGGIYANGTADVIDTTLTITGSTFSNNTVADDGGGIHVGSASVFTMDDTDVTGNRAESDGVNTNHGGGVRVAFGSTSPSTGVITNSRITGNFAESDGAGLYAGSAFELTIDNTIFEDNEAGDDAGGITLRTDTNVTITNSTFVNNTAADNAGGVYVFNNSTTSITDSSITGNTAVDFGGGAWVTSGATATFERSTIANNEATNGGGGGADVTAAAVAFVNSTVSGNTTGGLGGGLYLQIDPADPVVYAQSVMGTTITNNSADYGGGIYSGYYANPSVSGAIISGNTATTIGNDVYQPNPNAFSPAFSLIGDNDGNYLTESALDASGNIIGGPTNGVVDAMLGPLQDNGGSTLTHLLQAGSPAIDAGDPAVTSGTDQIGNARVWDSVANAAGGVVDMGSVEYLSQAGVVCDFDSDGNCDLDDIDLLQADVVAGNNSAAFDLNGDGNVDLADRDQWLLDAAVFNGFATPYQTADFNLDRVVDVSDFNIWNGNKFTTSSNFSGGDSNVDGSIDVSDFNIWNTQKFQSADSASRTIDSVKATALYSAFATQEELRAHRDNDEIEIEESADDGFDMAFAQDRERTVDAAQTVVSFAVATAGGVSSESLDTLSNVNFDTDAVREVIFSQVQSNFEIEDSADDRLRISDVVNEIFAEEAEWL